MGFVMSKSECGYVFTVFHCHKFHSIIPPHSSIHFVSFHFIRHCDGASGMVSRHPCYSQWTKWSLGTFFLEFLPFSPATLSIAPFLHLNLIHFISSPLCWCGRMAAGILVKSQTFNIGVSSHLIPPPSPVLDTS